MDVKKLNKAGKKPLPIIIGLIVVGFSVGVLFAATKVQVNFTPRLSEGSSNYLSAIVNNEAFDSTQTGDDGLAADHQSEDLKNLDKSDDQLIQNPNGFTGGTLTISNGKTGNSNSGNNIVGLSGNSNPNGPTIVIDGNGTNGDDSNGNGGNGGTGSGNTGVNSGTSLVHDGSSGNKPAFGDDGDDFTEEVVNGNVNAGMLGMATSASFAINQKEPMYLCPGENPSSQYISSNLNVVITFETQRGTMIADGLYIYKNNKLYGGDYSIDWDADSDNGIQDSISNEIGKHKAKIFLNNSVKNVVYEGPYFEYEVIDYRVKLQDFNENFSKFNNDELIQTIHCIGDRSCDLTSSKQAMVRQLITRTNSGKAYIHTYKKVGDNYEGYFVGWSKSKNATSAKDNYTMSRSTSYQIDKDGTHYYEETLYPVWDNNPIIVNEFHISVNSYGEMVLDGFNGNCSTVKSIDIPEGVSVFDLKSFCSKDYPNLELINIPSSVKEIIYPDNLNSIPKLSAFGVADGNKTFVDVNGILYSKNGKILLHVPPAVKEIKNWSERLTTIDTKSFIGIVMETLELPVSVTDVNDEGFVGCEISNLIINSNIDFGRDAFKTNGKDELTVNKIRVADSADDDVYIAAIQSFINLFDGDGYDGERITFKTLDTVSGLTVDYGIKDNWIVCDDGKTLARTTDSLNAEETIPDGITAIKTNTFKDNKKVSSLTIPSDVTTIQSNCFNSNILKAIYFKSNNPPTLVSERGTFTINPSLTLYIPDKQYNIYNSRWKRVTANTDIEAQMKPYGDSVTTEESSGAVYWETSPGQYILVDGKKVSGEYTIKDGTTEIKKVAFYGNTSITGVILSKNMRIINDSAFESCTALSKVVVTGNNLYTIGNSAFLFNGSLNTFIWETAASTNSLDSIGKYAFMATALTGLPSSDTKPTVTDENINTYKSCVVFEGYDTEGQILFSQLSSIGRNAFASCRSMGTVSVPTGLNPFGFDGWNGLIKSRLKTNWYYGSGMRGNINVVGSALEALNSDAEITTDDDGDII